MNRKQANVYLATILTTVAEAKDSMLGGIPSGHLYAALMGRMSLEEFNMLIGICKEGGLLIDAHHLLTLTPKGQEMAKKIETTLQSKGVI